MRPIKISFPILICLSIIANVIGVVFAETKAKQIVNIAYLAQERELPTALSNLDPVIPDEGVLGAELAISDNNTTGEFIGQQFVLKKFIATVDDNAIDILIKYCR